MLSVWQHLAIEDKISSESHIGWVPLKDSGGMMVAYAAKYFIVWTLAPDFAQS